MFFATVQTLDLAPKLPLLCEQFPQNALGYYDSENPESLAMSIVDLSENDFKRKNIAKSLYNYVCKHTWNAHARKVLEWGGISIKI